MGIVQAIAMSGGFKDSAKRSQVVLLRRADSEFAEVKVFDAQKLMDPKGTREDIRLRPDDTLLVRPAQPDYESNRALHPLRQFGYVRFDDGLAVNAGDDPALYFPVACDCGPRERGRPLSRLASHPRLAVITPEVIAIDQKSE